MGDRPNFVIPILSFLAILCMFGVYFFYPFSKPNESIPTPPAAPQAQQTQDVATAPTAAPHPPIQAPDPQPVAPPIRVSIDQLAADYQENEFNADSKYKWKNLEIYGTIARIQKSTEGDPVLVLKNFSDFGGVVALLDDSEEDQVITLRPLQTITLLCVGGGTIQERPVVGKCRIKPPDPLSPPPAQ